MNYVEMYQTSVEYDNIPFWAVYKNVRVKLRSWGAASHRDVVQLAIL